MSTWFTDQSRAQRVLTLLMSKYEAAVGSERCTAVHEFLSSQDFLKICEQVFLAVDKDNSQTIDRAELPEAFRLVVNGMPDASALATIQKQALTEDLSIRVFALLDENGDGVLDASEFVSAVRLIWIEAITLAALPTSAEIIVGESLSAYAALAGFAAANKVSTFFNSFEFTNLCSSTFAHVDADYTDALSPAKLQSALKIIGSQQIASSAAAGLTIDGVDIKSALDQVTSDVTSRTFHLLDTDRSGSLSRFEFPAAVKLIYIEALKLAYLAQHGTAGSLVTRAIAASEPAIGAKGIAEIKAFFTQAAFEADCTLAFHHAVAAASAAGSPSAKGTQPALGPSDVMRGLFYLAIEGEATAPFFTLIRDNIISIVKDVGSEILHSCFQAVDSDRNGTLCASEFPTVAKLLVIELARRVALRHTEIETLKAAAVKDAIAAAALREAEAAAAQAAAARPAWVEAMSDAQSAIQSEFEVIARAKQVTFSAPVQAALAGYIDADPARCFSRTLAAEALAREFCTAGFERACDATFVQADVDKSGTLTTEELATVFVILLDKVPGARQKLAAAGVWSSEQLQQACLGLLTEVSRVLGVYGRPLSYQEFGAAARIMWVKLM